MKLALITGGSRGLGKSLVTQLSGKGWTVKEFSRSGEGDTHIDGDLSKPETMNRELKTIMESYKREEIREFLFIHNAAVLEPIKKFEQLNFDDFERHYNINIKSLILLLKRVMNRYRECDIKKSVINISSGAALKGHAGWTLYCMSKAASENLFNAIYREEIEQEFPYRVFNYDPSIMDTTMQQEIRNAKSEDFPELERFLNFKKDGKLSNPDDVAEDLIRIINSNTYEVRYKYGHSATKE